MRAGGDGTDGGRVRRGTGSHTLAGVGARPARVLIHAGFRRRRVSYAVQIAKASGGLGRRHLFSAGNAALCPRRSVPIVVIDYASRSLSPTGGRATSTSCSTSSAATGRAATVIRVLKRGGIATRRAARRSGRDRRTARPIWRSYGVTTKIVAFSAQPADPRHCSVRCSRTARIRPPAIERVTPLAEDAAAAHARASTAGTCSAVRLVLAVR